MSMYFLIADDSAAKLQMLTLFVEQAQLGVEILTAPTTEAAKQHIDEHPDIAAAFIDYEIPTEFGPAVMTYLREANPQALIACVSSGGSDTYRQRAQAAGADAYVCTSYDIEEVKGQIESLLLEWKVQLSK